jgi:hypothetical protein
MQVIFPVAIPDSGARPVAERFLIRAFAQSTSATTVLGVSLDSVSNLSARPNLVERSTVKRIVVYSGKQRSSGSALFPSFAVDGGTIATPAEVQRANGRRGRSRDRRRKAEPLWTGFPDAIMQDPFALIA